MSKHFIVLTLSMAALLSACGGGVSEPPTYDEPESEASIQPIMSGTAVTVDCASDGSWTCLSEYGGSIRTVDYLVGDFNVIEMFSDFNSVEGQMSGIRGGGWSDAELVEESEIGGETVMVVESASAGKVKWLMLRQLDGKDDFAVKCEATLDAGTLDTYRASIEEMCQSARAV